MFKIGEYEVTVKKGDSELEALPSDLPVFDFEGNSVTLEEARAGNMRQSDYSRKTAEVAEVNKLFKELNITDVNRGVGVIRHLLNTQAELEDRGIIDSATGEIVFTPGEPAPTLDADGKPIVAPAPIPAGLSPEVQLQMQQMANRLSVQEKDMGSLLAIMSNRDIETAFPDLSQEHLQWVNASARDNPEFSPMHYAKELSEQLKAWGQKSVDDHAVVQEKLKADELARISGKEGIEIYGEDVQFRFDPSTAKEGEKVLTPTEAATEFIEAQAAAALREE